MVDRRELLREVMATTGTTQSQLAKLSGVRQPSISQMLAGRIELSDTQLDRLVACMGFRVEVTRRVIPAEVTRSERRSWMLHRDLSSMLTAVTLAQWRPTIERNLERLRGQVVGQPHARHLERWASLVASNDVAGLHRVLTGLDRESIEMREVSPMGGILPIERRGAVLAER